MSSSSAPFSNSSALTDSQITAFGNAHGFEITIIDLDEFNSNPDAAGKYCALFTGNHGDKYNTLPKKVQRNGDKEIVYDEQKITKHWLGLYGNLIFDSYGYQKDFTFPADFEFTHTYPKRLQEYDSAVCGEYVCAFLYYCNKTNADPTSTDVGREFSLNMGFSVNRKENDNKVLAWFKKENSTAQQ